ncbi:MAG TPA: TetR/AcrR family transcriptional regulator [Pseudogracilibacillus sp.]|nr:TetR/AcrR family transcriptional regulator [Pseudogracilibacillus sp.]
MFIINSTFFNLNTSKQEKIINAAFQEFAATGYDKASTNSIVQEATISKGSLFNYFHNKKDLYVYLIDYSLQVVEEIYNQIDFQETDIFKRIENIGFQKLYIQQKYPQVFDFLAAAVQEEATAVKSIIQHKITPLYKEGTEKMYQNIDYTKFRDDIDVEKAMEILNWTMFGFGEKGLHELKTFYGLEEFGERYLQKWKQYAAILKQGFYKEKFLF